MDFTKFDLSEYRQIIMARADKVVLRAEKMAEEAAKKAEKMAQEAEKMAREAEKIAKKVSDDMEEFVRKRLGPGFYHTHDRFDNHDRCGPAPTTTIYHHHHTTLTATETSTATITSTAVATSTFVATSFTTVTHSYLPGPTDIAASAITPTFNNAATIPLGEYFGYAATVKFWVLAFLLSIHCIILNILLYPGPRDPNTKSPTRPNPRASSLAGTEMDLTWLKPCITTRSRRIFAIIFCRIFVVLYLLEGFWYLDTLLRMAWLSMGTSSKSSNHWSVIFSILLMAASFAVTGFLLYKALNQQFALDCELVMLEVPGDVRNGPTRKDKKMPRPNAHGGRGREETDKSSIESGSEGDWQKDGF